MAATKAAWRLLPEAALATGREVGVGRGEVGWAGMSSGRQEVVVAGHRVLGEPQA